MGLGKGWAANGDRWGHGCRDGLLQNKLAGAPRVMCHRLLPAGGRTPATISPFRWVAKPAHGR